MYLNMTWIQSIVIPQIYVYKYDKRNKMARWWKQKSKQNKKQNQANKKKESKETNSNTNEFCKDTVE